ncbi:MOSC domain-containing protein [Paenibacillus wynnii]|uniref:MOSC domain-containing protein n=1 Tax=Paenibacillus wynnii TaxID=268407 RepID=UPI002792362C|nr:MOSC domain-containing protein [Paenibacillus wynnii]MDQ0192262.1 MOSC domain-containing protein YiiM [Paenibacillus wynnii]
MKVESLNIGRPITVDYHGKALETGIYKLPARGPVHLSVNGLEGDGQADLVNHGGPDKALCVYPLEHYAYWEEQLDKKLEYAAFGENITTTGLLETEVCIGDIYEIGTALLQVSQPRYPCFKLSQKHGASDMPVKVLTSGYSGFYLRVLREGEIAADDTIVKKQTGLGAVPVSKVLHLMEVGRKDKTGLADVIELDSLAEGIRSRFRDWLESPGS